eukprot:CAMPEP_0174834900 /NCGR_PEP_ID=MMETSP1114-20130205/5114_1 /TAXON_ID=312471 /ORGANISM="Neobodo designis, Strain CCAP 1951/1" /LENGTH=361 /DNA_ID=CAMNT_0016068829 /DNA_START=68 /DNA_END=1153 /DNA_ORIENTATION=-
MKLTLRVTSEASDANGAATAAPAEHSLVIRNPRATVANLRAAVAVTLKAAPSTLRMLVAGNELEDEKQSLADAHVVDGAVVEVVRKRPRADAPATDGAATTDAAETSQAARRHRAEAERPVGGPTNNIDRLIEMAMAQGGAMVSGSDGSDDGDDEEGYSDLGSLGEDEAFEFGDGLGGLGDGGSSDGGSDLFAEMEEGDAEADTPELREQAELVAGLIQLPNFETLKARFDNDPRAAMADLQTTNPQLFNLIARHPQFFLDFLNSPHDDLNDDDDDDDSEFGGSPVAPNQPIVSSSAARTSSAAAAPSAAQRNPTEADTRKIEELMQLGFSREQCTDAYWRHGRNPDRAAAWLFDNATPSS